VVVVLGGTAVVVVLSGVDDEVVVVGGSDVVVVAPVVVVVAPVVVVVAPVVVVVAPVVVVVPPWVVVVVAPVVVVVAAVVVVVAPVVVVVEPPVVGGVSVPKRMVTEAESFAWSPYVRVQVSPAACWVGVGGQGYRAASAVGLVPAVSVLGQVAAAGDGPHGGPTFPSTTLNVVDIVPVAEVTTSLPSDGAVQLTEIELLMGEPSATFG
jgi:hypothetical protein